MSAVFFVGRSGIDGVRYLRAIGYFSMSQCATGPARERKVVLDGLGWKDKNQRTYYSYTMTAW